MAEFPADLICADAAETVRGMAGLLEGMRLYGRERKIEEALSSLDLPAMHPSTLLLAGPAASCPSRFLAGCAGFLGGQQLPAAQVTCDPAHREAPNSLVAHLIAQYLSHYSFERVQHLIGPLAQMYPWLAWLFPQLRALDDPPPLPPDNSEVVRHALAGVLGSMAREMPHLAIVQHLHDADAESLAILDEILRSPLLGLRLLATVDEQVGDKYPAWSAFREGAPAPLTLPPLSVVILRGYLGEIAEELDSAEYAERLHAASGGEPFMVETVLRAWAYQGVLKKTEQGWEMVEQAEDEETPDPDFDLDDVLLQLGQAALVGSTTLSFLALLWSGTEENTARTVEYGRLLGILAPPDPQNPDEVAFTDLDARDGAAARMNAAQRREAHAAIAHLLEETVFRQQQRDSVLSIAYHYRDAGDEESADNFFNAARVEMPVLPAGFDAKAALNANIVSEWDIAPPLEVDDRALRLITRAALAVRLAAVQYRLYPLHGAPVIENTDLAMSALERLLAARHSLTITYDGTTIAFDGKAEERKDMAMAVRDFQRWMQVGFIQAIGFARGVTRHELSRFLNTLANHEPVDGFLSFLSKIASLNLKRIRVLSWYFVINSLPRPRDEEEVAGVSFSHDSVLAFLASGMSALPEMPAEEEASSAVTGMLPPAELEPSPADDFLIIPENRARLARRLAASPPSVRKLLLANVLQWLRDHENDEEIIGEIDAPALDRLVAEDDPEVMPDTLRVVEIRLEYYLARIKWARVRRFLRTLFERYEADTDTRIHLELGNSMARICDGQTYIDWLNTEDLDSAEGVGRLRDYTAMLGDHALRPLMDKLFSYAGVGEDEQFIKLWKTVEGENMPVLITALRGDHPWHVYRNILTLLARLAGPEALAAVSEKCSHPNPYVRAEALATAAGLAGPDATPYIVRGLEDADPHVCATAARLSIRRPSPRMLELLLTALNSRRWGAEGQPAQIAAIEALGHYRDEEAHAALLRVLNPPLISLHKPTSTLRCAALAALAHHADDPVIRAAIRRACADKDPTLREAADHAWQQTQRGGTREMG